MTHIKNIAFIYIDFSSRFFKRYTIQCIHDKFIPFGLVLVRIKSKLTAVYNKTFSA